MMDKSLLERCPKQHRNTSTKITLREKVLEKVTCARHNNNKNYLLLCKGGESRVKIFIIKWKSQAKHLSHDWRRYGHVSSAETLEMIGRGKACQQTWLSRRDLSMEAWIFVHMHMCIFIMLKETIKETFCLRLFSLIIHVYDGSICVFIVTVCVCGLHTRVHAHEVWCTFVLAHVCFCINMHCGLPFKSMSDMSIVNK